MNHNANIIKSIENGYFVLTLMPSLQCSLDCPHCYLTKEERTNPYTMPVSEVISACSKIDRYYTNKGHNIKSKIHYAILDISKKKNVLAFMPKSRVSFSDKKRPKVYINGNGLDTQVFLQSEINGVFSEKIVYSKESDTGGVVELPPLWADHYGIVVSFGNSSAHNLEHKHVIQGHFNKPATRIFYKGGEFYDNSKSFPYTSIIGIADTIDDIQAILAYAAYEQNSERIPHPLGWG